MSAQKISGFKILDARNAEDVETWTALWETWASREVQAYPAYARLFEDDGSRAIAAVYVGAEGSVLYPLLFRDLTAEKCSCPAVKCADVIVPYGYGGPYCWNCTDRDALSLKFWQAFSDWAMSENVVSEFVRFSLFEDSLLPYPGSVEDKQLNVVRSLDPDEEAIWADFDRDVRTNVRRAQRFELRVEFDTTGDTLDDFLRIYYGTMDRRSAEQMHYRERSFFEGIHAMLPGHFVYAHAKMGDVVGSTELVLLSEDTAYAFLGGTDTSMFQYRANDLLRYEIILWARRHGKRRYVLGGGYVPNDGIFRFKKAFAPTGTVPFRTGSRVFQPDAYSLLIDTKRKVSLRDGEEWSPRSDYFPQYRS